MVDFDTGIFTAQLVDKRAKYLNAAAANGGPRALVNQLSKFFIGVNDPFGQNPMNTAFTPEIFNLFSAWNHLPRSDGATASREQIARGEAVFNGTAFNITGVGGINDVLQQTNVSGFCGTCHDSPNVANHSIGSLLLNTGVTGGGADARPALDVSDLPLFTLKCVSGALSGRSFIVTDPGRALISGRCADIGKIKVPILRALSSRAPYFHNGSAETLLDVVNFYDQRFGIGFTVQQKLDLVAFLSAL
jgi:cytochrome c peroxidase